jgi:hypothetical protein
MQPRFKFNFTAADGSLAKIPWQTRRIHVFDGAT